MGCTACVHVWTVPRARVHGLYRHPPSHAGKRRTRVKISFTLYLPLSPLVFSPLQVLIEKKMNTFSMKSGLTLGDFGWGSKTFAKMGREKIRLIGLFLKLGVDVVIADVDVLWLRNPLPFFAKYPEV